MLSLLRKLLRVPRYEVIRRDIIRIKPHEWRTNPTLVKIAKTFLDNVEFRMMLDCVRNIDPALMVFLEDVSIEQRALTQAKIEGFMQCLNAIESLGIPTTQRKDLHATYEAPDEDMRLEENE